MKTMKEEPGTQAAKLAHFRLGYRFTPHTATGCSPAELLMGRRICTRLDILHPDLSARMSENSKLADHTTRRVFLPRDPVMVKDYRNRERPRIKGVIQDRWGLSLAELWWETCFGNNTLINFYLSLVQKWLKLEQHPRLQKMIVLFPEVVPLRQTERPFSETSAVQADLNDFLPSPCMPSLVPVPTPEEPDLSSAPQPQMPEVTKTEEPVKIPVSKHYPTRVHSKPKGLIEEM